MTLTFLLTAFAVALLFAYYRWRLSVIAHPPDADRNVPHTIDPLTLSPAALRYLWQAKCDYLSLAATLIHFVSVDLVRIVRHSDAFTIEATSEVEYALHVKILQAIRHQSPMSLKMLARKLSLSQETLAEAVAKLASVGVPVGIDGEQVYQVADKQPDKLALLSPEERRVALKLLGMKQRLDVTNNNFKRFSDTLIWLRGVLKSKYSRIYFHRFDAGIGMGPVLSVLILIGLTRMFIWLQPATAPLFPMVYAVVISMLMLTYLIPEWLPLVRQHGDRRWPGLFVVFVTLVLLACFTYSFYVYLLHLPAVCIFVVAGIVFNVHAITRIRVNRTHAGECALREIEAFRRYLLGLDTYRDWSEPVTAAHFWRFLPQAIALEASDGWIAHFAASIHDPLIPEVSRFAEAVASSLTPRDI